jgi:hypothetical protein
MDYTALEINPEWPAANGQAPRLAGQFGHWVKIKTQDGRLEGRIKVQLKD